MRHHKDTERPKWMDDPDVRGILESIKQDIKIGGTKPKVKNSHVLWTLEQDAELLQAFKPYAQQWGKGTILERREIASKLAVDLKSHPFTSIYYRLDRVLLLAESLDKIVYKKTPKVKVETKEAETQPNDVTLHRVTINK